VFFVFSDLLIYWCVSCGRAWCFVRCCGLRTLVVFYVWRSVSRDEMYGRIFFSVVLVHALWSFSGRSSGGLPKMSEICCGIRRESQAACPAL